MAPVLVLDKYYLGITILVTIGYQLLGFFIAWTFQARPTALSDAENSSENPFPLLV